jgi:hypothetical protein
VVGSASEHEVCGLDENCGVAGVGAVAGGRVASVVGPLREVGACSLAGMLVGAFVGGVGGRLAMRISAIAAGPSLQGVTTEAGFPVGEITGNGTLGLVFFAGVLSGAIGGLFYAAVRPWLAGLGRWQGIAFGVLLLGVLGSAVLNPLNTDFGRFGPVALNVALFAPLFVIFGIFVPPVAARFERAGARGAAFDVLLWLAAIPALLFLALGLGQALGDQRQPAAPLFLGLLAVALGQRWYFTRGGARFERLSDLPSGRAAALSYLVIAVPVLATTWLTLSAIVWIFRLAV